MIRFVDLFSGVGGFRLGLKKTNQERWILRQPNMHRYSSDSNELLQHEGNAPSGDQSQESNSYFKCVWSCDNDKYANQVYKYHWGGEDHFSDDVRGVDPETIPGHDLLCAGFPCQSFSVAGKRLGFQDPRGTFFYEILRIAEAKRPPLLLLENVRGLLSVDRGQAFKTVLQELGRIGYWCEWQVLNSKHFGVPQNRQRVFIVGHLAGSGRSGREVFPVFGDDEEVVKDRSVVRTLQGGGHSGGLHSRMTGLAVELAYTKANMREGRFSEVSHALDGGSSKGVMLGSQQPTVRTGGGGSLDRHAWDTLITPYFDGRKGCQTLKSQRVPEIGLGNMRIRRLTPIECERLQGFPDNWTRKGVNEKGETVPISDTQRYKMLGNAVTVNIIEFLGKLLMEKCFNLVMKT